MSENISSSNRRDFLKKVSLGTAAAISIPEIVSAAMGTEKVKKIPLKKEDVILFQGDSITDVRRKRDDKNYNSPAALGMGYAFIASSELLYKHADKNLKIYNKGISGNKVFQLAERWEEDCIDLQPTVLSILIGVNDYWHTLANKYDGTVKKYQDDYKELLDRTRQRFPDIRLIIGEPFALPGIQAVDESWFPAFNDYRFAAREIANHYEAAYIPYQAIFDKASKSAPGAYWAYDGVHPSLAGAKLMAQAWLETIK